MSKTIVQKVLFKNTTPAALYELYMDAKKHTLATGAPAKITAKEGAPFSAHDGHCKGKNLNLVKNRLIVQTWRGADWNKNDLDSIFIIQLEPKGKDTVLHAIHANLPDKHAASINKGWHDYYWKPWKTYLSGKTVKKQQDM